MNWVRFFIYQFILFIALLLLNVYSDSYISKPFTRVDLIAICISTPIFVLIVVLIGKLYMRFKTKLRNKILLSITAFVLAIICIAIIENIWFELKGEMLFN
ncbi:hypothetical protein FHP05_06065 [Cerasibacillus terrae]|uniref:Uncharacterized protein n=1 Tax=Cerasibacillus terrae TaxID=2498845 RepID=A0A5C8NWN8_9BACI|nr:hypothetical protein FHP05_06065 [Cerasibacillus terrae]